MMINTAYSQYSMCHLSLHHHFHVAFGSYGGRTILKGRSLKRIFHSHSETRTSLKCLSYTAENRMPTDALWPQTDPPNQAKMFTELFKRHYREHLHSIISLGVLLIWSPLQLLVWVLLTTLASEKGQPGDDAASKGTRGASAPKDAKCLLPSPSLLTQLWASSTRE